MLDFHRLVLAAAPLVLLGEAGQAVRKLPSTLSNFLNPSPTVGQNKLVCSPKQVWEIGLIFVDVFTTLHFLYILSIGPIR